MPHCHISSMVIILTSPSEKVHQKNVPERPLDIIMLENRVARGIVAPDTHSICISSADASHFSPIAITINSLATSPKPNISGKVMKVARVKILKECERFVFKHK